MGLQNINSILDRAYEAFEGNQLMEDYMERHEVRSLGILTVTDDETAALIAGHLKDRIEGKVVVEIGGGIGLLALHMAEYASRVFVIEASPAWTHIWTMLFMARKPKNVTFIFGAAQEMFGQLNADVAVFCTHSAAQDMRSIGERLAGKVIDVYGEIVPILEPHLASLQELRQ